MPPNSEKRLTLLRFMKYTAQTQGKAMGHLVALERHLNLTHLSDLEKVPLLDTSLTAKGYLLSELLWEPWGRSSRWLRRTHPSSLAAMSANTLAGLRLRHRNLDIHSLNSPGNTCVHLCQRLLGVFAAAATTVQLGLFQRGFVKHRVQTGWTDTKCSLCRLKA